MADETRPRTEPRGIPVKMVTGVLVGIAMLVIVSVWAMRLFMATQGGPVATAPATLPNQSPTFPPPRLSVAPRAELKAYDAEQQRKLDGWAWVDRDKGIARIPIEDAMRLLESRGWPKDSAGGAGQ